MQSEFRFTRHGCKPTYDVTIRLLGEQANEFSVAYDPTVSLALGNSTIAAIALGIQSAYRAAAPHSEISVTVIEVIDHSGVTGDLGFKICGEAATNCLLGLPDKAPHPGYLL